MNRLLADPPRRSARGQDRRAWRISREDLETSHARLERLSDREREVLALLGQGLTNAEICEHLVVSLPTTKTHVANVLAKLVLRDRVQAAIFAHRNRLV